MLEARAVVRLYRDLLDERPGWLQRVHASLFHLGAPDLDVGAMSAAGRELLAVAELSPATRNRRPAPRYDVGKTVKRDLTIFSGQLTLTMLLLSKLAEARGATEENLLNEVGSIRQEISRGLQE